MVHARLATLAFVMLVACATAEPSLRGEPSSDELAWTTALDLNVTALSVRAELLVRGWDGIQNRLLAAERDLSSTAVLYTEVITTRRQE